MSKKTSNTKYEFIRQEILRRIRNGEFSETGRIPSENELSKSYRVSVITTRKALDELVLEGRIIRIKGKGSYLVEDNLKSHAKRKKLTGRGSVTLILTSYEESDSCLLNIMKGVHSVLSDNGYTTVVEYSMHDSHAESDILDRCLRDKASGVLVFAADSGADLSKLITLEKSGIPFVMLDRNLKNYPCTLVASYSLDGMYKMVEYLIQLGHRRIAYVSGALLTNVQEDRLRGYKLALERYGIEFRDEFFLVENYPQSHLLPSLIKDQKVSAIACINDRTALNIAAFLKKEGFSIPKDVSLTGFDDSALSSYADLTTARQPFFEIGALGAQKLIDLLQKKSGNSQTLLPVELVIRGSTCAFKE